MEDFRISVKSFIVSKEEKLFLLKRRDSDSHTPGAWEIPGGRLEKGEDPFEGLKRETREESGLEVSVESPLKVHHFTRDDGQKITMITFLCRPETNSPCVGEEHTDYKWADIEKAEEIIHPAFREEIEVYRNLYEE